MLRDSKWVGLLTNLPAVPHIRQNRVLAELGRIFGIIGHVMCVKLLSSGYVYIYQCIILVTKIGVAATRSKSASDGGLQHGIHI